MSSYYRVEQTISHRWRIFGPSGYTLGVCENGKRHPLTFETQEAAEQFAKEHGFAMAPPDVVVKSPWPFSASVRVTRDFHRRQTIRNYAEALLKALKDTEVEP